MSGNNKALVTGAKVAQPLLILLLFVVLLSGCKWPNRTYDEINAIRKEALALVESSSTADFTSKKSEIDMLNSRMDAVIKLGTPKIGVKMMQQVVDEARNTWGGFVKLWREQGRLTTAAVPSVKAAVDSAFIEVLSLGKKDPGIVSL
jgi:hypothetical protein